MLKDFKEISVELKTLTRLVKKELPELFEELNGIESKMHMEYTYKSGRLDMCTNFYVPAMARLKENYGLNKKDDKKYE